MTRDGNLVIIAMHLEIHSHVAAFQAAAHAPERSWHIPVFPTACRADPVPALRTREAIANPDGLGLLTYQPLELLV